jgi:cleavage and polyadenylation specificity factor subunit 1
MLGFAETPLQFLCLPTRLKETRDACALSALSINVRQKRQPVIWSVPGLPSDACGLMAVPRGGVLVLSQNLLMYYAQVC